VANAMVLSDSSFILCHRIALQVGRIKECWPSLCGWWGSAVVTTLWEVGFAYMEAKEACKW